MLTIRSLFSILSNLLPDPVAIKVVVVAGTGSAGVRVVARVVAVTLAARVGGTTRASRSRDDRNTPPTSGDDSSSSRRLKACPSLCRLL